MNYDDMTIWALKQERAKIDAELSKRGASLDEAVERDAARYRWLAGNIEMLPYPDQWAGKEWLDGEIDKRRNAPVRKE